MFKELKETSHNYIRLKKNVEHEKVNSYFNVINIPGPKRKRTVSRVHEKYEKSKATADIAIKHIKKLLTVHTVEEGLDLQDNFFLKPPETLTTNREKIKNVSSDSEGETNSEFFKSQRTNIFIDLNTNADGQRC